MSKKNTTAIKDKLSNKISTNMQKNMSKYKKVISSFIQKRQEQLYKPAPMDRIYFNTDDADELFKAIDISREEVKDAIDHTYYADINPFNPAAAKDEFTILALMIVRYFLMKNMKKELDLALVHLAFSGKFYPSIHYRQFPKAPPSENEHIMLYVVNNALSNKYDLKSEGSVIGTIRSISNTWINSYDDKIKRMTDEDAVYVIQQLHNRIGSFMKNIADEFYKAYENKEYISYDSDNFDEDNYHMADSDSLKAERVIEKTLETLNTSGINYKICKMCADSNIKTDEVKAIIESILSDTGNNKEIRELVTLIVHSYFSQSKTKDVRDIDFINYTLTPKPNSKDPIVNRQKDLIIEWLDENSPGFRKRRSREATKNSYVKAILTYFTISIHNANK